MRRAHILMPGAALAVAVSTAGVAWAAASPAVRTGPATKITNTTAVLTATVNPNGERTSYAFSIGPTTAYGETTATRSAGAGAKPAAVTATVTGLTPGTVYHYRISALNRSGATSGADRTFTTTGHPPAGVVTGGALNVGPNSATVTGTINPEGAVTQWAVQYGLTAAYQAATQPQTLPAGAQPVTVSAQLSGLSSETLFHYRIVTSHPDGTTSVGADQTFFTEPLRRPVPRLIAHTVPGRRRRRPYTFTTHGFISNVGVIPALQRCTGNVGIRYDNGRRQVAFVLAPISANCRFAIPATFRRLRGPAPAALTVRVTFRGNGYVASAERTDHVTAG